MDRGRSNCVDGVKIDVKRLARKVLNLFKINVRYQITPGISILGFNFFIDPIKGRPKYRAVYALEYIKAINPKTVLDVGSGAGWHAKELQASGAEVTCIDYGSSVYAKTSAAEGLNVIRIDFNKYTPARKFGVVWASHILEHQRNVGAFIERLVDCCDADGYVCITLPDPHRNLWGGHLSIWSPGLLAYNVVLCGVDLSGAVFIRGTNEFSLLFKPVRFSVPEGLTYDSGDLVKLAPYLPSPLGENADPWRIKYR